MRRLRFGEAGYNEVMDFLIEESRLLDEGELGAWLALTAPDLSYTMPVRRTAMRNQGAGFSDEMFHFEEDRPGMEFRIKRLTESGNAFADDPPSRTRRLVTNVRVHETADGDYAASSSLLLLRSRWDSPSFDIISCSRQDLLRRYESSFQIATRRILVDQATIGTANLAVIL